MSLPINALAIWIAFFSIFFPLLIPISRIWKSPEIKKLELTLEEKKQRRYFLALGLPIGIVLGFLLDIPVIFDMLGWHREWFFVLIQFFAAGIFIPILIIVMGARAALFIAKLNIFEKNKGISEGIFIAVLAWQVLLFFSGNHEVLIPGFNESFGDWKDHFVNFTG